jgi:hypothetical protein
LGRHRACGYEQRARQTNRYGAIHIMVALSPAMVQTLRRLLVAPLTLIAAEIVLTATIPVKRIPHL